MNWSLGLQRVAFVFWLLCALGVVLLCVGGVQGDAPAGIVVMVAIPLILFCLGGYWLTRWVIRQVFGTTP